MFSETALQNMLPENMFYASFPFFCFKKLKAFLISRPNRPSIFKFSFFSLFIFFFFFSVSGQPNKQHKATKATHWYKLKEILTSPKTTHCYKITFRFKKVEADIISASEQALQHTTIPFFSVLFLSFSLVFPAAKHKQRETIKPMHFKWIKRINQNLSNRFHSQRDQPAGTAPSGDELYENWLISLQNDVG